eukprot:5786042-Prymnesium_polylepis.1
MGHRGQSWVTVGNHGPSWVIVGHRGVPAAGRACGRTRRMRSARPPRRPRPPAPPAPRPRAAPRRAAPGG